MIDGGGAAERPLPVGFALHPRTGLVAGDHIAGAHGGGDGVCGGAERRAHAGQHVGDRALRDGQPEQAFAHFGQPLEADHLAAVQIRDRRLDAGAERGPFRHVRRCRCGDPGFTAWAGGAEQVDPCGDRLDHRQIDMVESAREVLAGLGKRGATPAALGVDVARRIRVFGERARRTRMTFADFLLRRGDVRLLTVRRWQ